MASNTDIQNNYRGSAREYPKSSANAMAPGRDIKISASDLSAKNMSAGTTETKIPKKRL
jgi:hypothetical protein